MDLTPIFYLFLTLAIFVVMMRIRKITTAKKPGPRVHRKTYQHVKL
jgi:hypothetical protein